jgi:acetyl esterase/lipase
MSGKVKSILRGSIFGALINLVTLPIAILDYYSWRASPIFLSHLTGILITLAFLYNSIYLGIICPRFNTTTKEGIRFSNYGNFLVLCGVGTAVGFYFLAIGFPWGFFMFLTYFFLTFCLQVVLIIFGFNIHRNKIEETGDFLFIDPKLTQPVTIISNLSLPDFLQKICLLGIKFFNLLLALLIIIMYILSGILTHAQITGGDPILGQVTGASAGLTTGFLILALVAITVFTIQYFALNRYPRLVKLLVILGIIMGGVFLLPVVNRPTMIKDADAQFEDTFGTGWANFPTSITSYTLSTPFVGSQFYYGYSWDRLSTPENYYYLNSSNHLFANYSDYQLYYDVKYPKPGYAGPTSIGKNTTIILLHSGGWNGGDKGMDAVQPTIHLASQGYVVFDVQYRLINSSLLDTKAEFGIEGLFQGTKPTQYRNVEGNYSIKDMIHDVGEFTFHLANLSERERFGARLDSVIFMGVSAGGYLASLTTYGYQHPWFAGNFSTALTIKGLILYNAPNDAEFFFYSGHPMYYPYLIRGSPTEIPEVYYYSTPSNFINASSVPTLLFHGTIDKMVPPVNSEQVYTKLREKGVTSIWIKGPFGGHGFDFGPYFSPVATYYVERFLFQILQE